MCKLDEKRVADGYQVADSFVGRWFKLEGCGHPKERIGSRFTVCLHDYPSLLGALMLRVVDGTACWTDDLGEHLHLMFIRASY